MNQCDFATPPNPHMRRYAIAAIIAGVSLFFAMLFCSCKETDPLPTVEEQLQGAWQREWLQLTNRYNFHAGSCDAYAIIPGQPYQLYNGVYSIRGDELTMMDLASGESRFGIVSFPTDSTAEIAWDGGIRYFLKRL